MVRGLPVKQLGQQHNVNEFILISQVIKRKKNVLAEIWDHKDSDRNKTKG